MEKISLRDAFGQELALQGEQHPELYVFAAGTSNSDCSAKFGEKFPERFFNFGINEANMVAAATGVAMAGKIVVASDMSIFLTCAYAQLITAARQGKIHLIIAASHTGIGVGADGGSAQDITDIGRMRLIPGFTIVAPWDGDHVKTALKQMIANPGLYYLRLNRGPLPQFTQELYEQGWISQRFGLELPRLLKCGGQLTVVTYGDMVHPALQAAKKIDPMFEQRIDVIGVSVIEPLDADEILSSVTSTERLIAVEDHMHVGGLSEQLPKILAEAGIHFRMRSVSLGRHFGTSGEPDELFKLYGLDEDSLIRAYREALDWQ
ncbi:MAG: hypothetical protein NTZ18_00060 [Candidatus Komeilibacteria bacterium]|nr:hypothetical protein [Candidatus Komeilibacteria bacterium]